MRCSTTTSGQPFSVLWPLTDCEVCCWNRGKRIVCYHVKKCFVSTYHSKIRWASDCKELFPLHCYCRCFVHSWNSSWWSFYFVDWQGEEKLCCVHVSKQNSHLSYFTILRCVCKTQEHTLELLNPLTFTSTQTWNNENRSFNQNVHFNCWWIENVRTICCEFYSVYLVFLPLVVALNNFSKVQLQGKPKYLL
jgi:hypothetical protein